MTLHATRTFRRSLRRTALGIALVLHLGWLMLGSGAASAASTGTADMSTMPCHGGMMHAAMNHGTPPPASPAHLPCCTIGCACAAGLCLIGTALAQARAERMQFRVPLPFLGAMASRMALPELRPPISS